MRLLNTKTFKFQEFFDDNIPNYAILSHCWGDDEVSYEKFLVTPEDERSGTGWGKILKLCETAGITGVVYRRHTHQGEELGRERFKFEWVWIDTCCIDKRSSAELSEAINSMYKWYNHAKICLVFLPDVHTVSGQASGIKADVQQYKVYAPFSIDQLRKSRWFSRGWTLQELVAPNRVAFYNTSYQMLSWRHDDLMLRLISQTTHIPEDLLSTPVWIKNAAIAIRISWASTRRTSRAEDMAYCLLGLCDVNMPLLYGEGAVRAFQRLQLEIISQSTDDSIFAWESSKPSENTLFLAKGPADFANCCDDVYIDQRCKEMRKTSPDIVYTKTQRGIEFDVEIPRGLRRRRHYDYICVPLRYRPRTSASVYLLLMEDAIGWSRQRAFVVDRNSFIYADIWKTLGRTKWYHFIFDVEHGKDLGKIQEHKSPSHFPVQYQLQKLWYKLYPAQTIHVDVPITDEMFFFESLD